VKMLPHRTEKAHRWVRRAKDSVIHCRDCGMRKHWPGSRSVCPIQARGPTLERESVQCLTLEPHQ
jgi:hypothetical protein